MVKITRGTILRIKDMDMEYIHGQMARNIVDGGYWVTKMVMEFIILRVNLIYLLENI